MSLGINSFQFYPYAKSNNKDSVMESMDTNDEVSMHKASSSTPNTLKFSNHISESSSSSDVLTTVDKDNLKTIKTYRSEILLEAKYRSGWDSSDEEPVIKENTAFYNKSIARHESVSNIRNRYYFDDTIEGFASDEEDEIERQFQDIYDEMSMSKNNDTQTSQMFTSEITLPNVEDLTSNAADQYAFLLEEETQDGAFNYIENTASYGATPIRQDAVIERIQFFNALAHGEKGLNETPHTSRNNFLNLLKSVKEPGTATISATNSNVDVKKQKEEWCTKLEVQLGQTEETQTTATTIEKRVKPCNNSTNQNSSLMRKGRIQRRRTGDKALNSIQRSVAGRTNAKMHAMMEDLSMVLPVKLRIAEYERRIAQSNSR